MIRIGTASYDRIKAGTIALALLLPVAFLGKLRFDLDTPQPTIWRIGTEAAKLIPNGGKLALLLPNDDSDSVGSMMRGVIMYAPPRRLGLSIATDTSSLTRIEGLDKALAAGFEFVLISCTPVGLPDDVPANVAALFDHVGGKWRALQTWTYPTGIRQKHFSGMIARGPVCAAPL